MVTRTKVSAVKRRIKRRSERKSRHNNKANLVRSRKQRARKTVRKIMKGGEGEGETIKLKLVEHSKPNEGKDAVTLTFTERKKFFGGTDTILHMSVDLNNYKGDIRELLHHLFAIDGYKPNITTQPSTLTTQPSTLNNYGRKTFLLGLADEPERDRVKKATEYAINRECNNDNLGIENKSNDKSRSTIVSHNELVSQTKKCDLEIKLVEENGKINFTVNRYHRMKLGEKRLPCIQYKVKEEKTQMHIIDDNTGEHPELENISGTHYDVLYSYPILEFASATGDGTSGINYIDYNEDLTKTKPLKGIANKFTFTTNGTIIELKKKLKEREREPIMLDDKGQFTTADDVKSAEAARIAAETALAERKKKNEERINKLKVDAAKAFNDEYRDSEDFKKLKDAIESTKGLTDEITKKKKENDDAKLAILKGETTQIEQSDLNTKLTTSNIQIDNIDETNKSLRIFREEYEGSDPETQKILEEYYEYGIEGTFTQRLVDYFNSVYSKNGNETSEIDKLLSEINRPAETSYD
jgi:hypothetical protein